MLDISLQDNRDLYINYIDCLQYLKSIDETSFDIPDDTHFHVYSEIKTEKELLCVESYLATQDLEKTNLILWSDYDISDNDLIQPYKNLIDMRVYDPVEEAKGTILEDNRKWILNDISDTRHYMQSGVLRFLVTHRYGGVWVDMDMVLLRNFAPILDQEWAYMWGSELDFINFGPCAAMMSIHKDSKHSILCLEEMLKTDVVSDSTVLDHVLLAKVYAKNPFTVFPSTFFNTEWQLNTVYVDGFRHYNAKGLGTQVENGWFESTDHSTFLFEGAFAWHWHNSSHKNKPIRPKSKFDILQTRTKNILREKGIT